MRLESIERGLKWGDDVEEGKEEEEEEGMGGGGEEKREKGRRGMGRGGG